MAFPLAFQAAGRFARPAGIRRAVPCRRPAASGADPWGSAQVSETSSTRGKPATLSPGCRAPASWWRSSWNASSGMLPAEHTHLFGSSRQCRTSHRNIFPWLAANPCNDALKPTVTELPASRWVPAPSRTSAVFWIVKTRPSVIRTGGEDNPVRKVPRCYRGIWRTHHAEQRSQGSRRTP